MLVGFIGIEYQKVGKYLIYNIKPISSFKDLEEDMNNPGPNPLTFSLLLLA